MTKYLTPLKKTELEDIFDERAQNIIQYFINKNQFAEPECVEKKDEVSFRVPKEHTEQWVVQALGMKPKGAGSYPVDAISNDGVTACDVGCMGAAQFTKKGEVSDCTTGEKSLGQTFKPVTIKGKRQTLDALFENGDYGKIATFFNVIFFEKFKTVLSDHPGIKNIYMFFILISIDSVFICGLKVNYSSKLRRKILKKSKDSVWMANFIDEEFGEVKVYKAKKRLEIRLRQKKWIKNEGWHLKFPITGDKTVMKLRDLSEEEFKDYTGRF